MCCQASKHASLSITANPATHQLLQRVHQVSIYLAGFPMALITIIVATQAAGSIPVAVTTHICLFHFIKGCMSC